MNTVLPRTSWHYIFTWPHKDNWIIMPNLSEGQIVVGKTVPHHYHHILHWAEAKKGKSTNFLQVWGEVGLFLFFILVPSLVYLSLKVLPLGSQLFGFELVSHFEQVLGFVFCFTCTVPFNIWPWWGCGTTRIFIYWQWECKLVRGNLAMSSKAKYRFTLRSSNSVVIYISKRNECIYPSKSI